MTDLFIAIASDYPPCYVHSMSLLWKQTEQNSDSFWDGSREDRNITFKVEKKKVLSIAIVKGIH